MKSKADDGNAEMQRARAAAARHLSKFKGKALVEEMERIVQEAEKEAGGKFQRYKGKMATPHFPRRRVLRRA